ncbi:MAG: hypothetical protein ACTSPC_04975, partial [Candidatus Heimdallarchaeota archaeon]
MPDGESTQKKSIHQPDNASHGSIKEKELLSVGFFEEDIEDRTRRYFGKANLEKIKNSTIL